MLSTPNHHVDYLICRGLGGDEGLRETHTPNVIIAGAVQLRQRYVGLSGSRQRPRLPRHAHPPTEPFRMGGAEGGVRQPTHPRTNLRKRGKYLIILRRQISE